MKLLLAASLFAGSMFASTVFLDQIGPSGSALVSNNVSTSQVFGAPYNSDNIAVLDDFTVSGSVQLTEIDAAVLLFNNATAADFASITGVGVEIYSSTASAASSLVGDVASVTVPLASLTLTRNFTGSNLSALAQLPVNIGLAPGTYWIAVIASLSFASTNGAEIGVLDGISGNSNAVQANPGGGFGFAGNLNALNSNAAYRIIGNEVPEPGTWALFASGIGLMLYARARRTA
jgi:PEP-CTERM motif